MKLFELHLNLEQPKRRVLLKDGQNSGANRHHQVNFGFVEIGNTRPD